MDDEVLAGPQLRQCRNARFCSAEGLRGLYDMRASVASQLKDTKGQTQTRLQMGNDLLERQIRLDFLGRLELFAIRSAYRASNHASPPELPCRRLREKIDVRHLQPKTRFGPIPILKSLNRNCAIPYTSTKSKRTKGRWVVTRACRKTAFRHFGVHIPKNAIYSGSTQATSPGLFTEISEFPIPSLAP